MNDPDVILRIYRHANRHPQQPMIRQRFGPKRVDLEPRRLHPFGLCGNDLLELDLADQQQAEGSQQCGADDEISLAGHGPSTDKRRLQVACFSATC